MTKKDYIKLAQAIKGNSDNGTSRTIYKASFLTDLCQILQEDNPHFDRERFRTACS